MQGLIPEVSGKVWYKNGRENTCLRRKNEKDL